MEAGVEIRPTTAAIIRHAQALQMKLEGENSTSNILNKGGQIQLSSMLTAHVRPGDEIDFPVTLDSAGTEIYIRKPAPSGRSRDVHQAAIGHAAQPKSANREQLYVHAEVSYGRLGISALYFPCELLRDYFYAADRRLLWEKQKTLYGILRIPRSARRAAG